MKQGAESKKQKAGGEKQKVESLKTKAKGKKGMKHKAVENPSEPKTSNDSNDSFDFGGLPERNLKKNLGCG